VKAGLKLRIPGWARNRPVPGTLYQYADTSNQQTTISLNGARVAASPDERGYVTLEREWRDGDHIELVFPMPVRRVMATAQVRETGGRVAFERGPLVYCAEWPEAADRQALALLLDEQTAARAEHDSSLFGGVTVLNVSARPIAQPGAAFRPVKMTPYALWANRGSGSGTIPFRVARTDANHLWAANSNSEVLFTTNGGKKWDRSIIQVSLGCETCSNTADIAFLNNNEGWAVINGDFTTSSWVWHISAT
jgi:hypothetical protein